MYLFVLKKLMSWFDDLQVDKRVFSQISANCTNMYDTPLTTMHILAHVSLFKLRLWALYDKKMKIDNKILQTTI